MLSLVAGGLIVLMRQEKPLEKTRSGVHRLHRKIQEKIE